MEHTFDTVENISSLLDSGKYKEILSVSNDLKLNNIIKNNCGDLISTIVGKIQDDTLLLKPSLHGACEELLMIIIRKAVPEEALLEFIEQIEVAKNDAQFSIILQPLQELLKKLQLKRGRSLEWCLNSITTYIESIPTANINLEGKARLLMDSDPNIRRVTRIYSILPSFYSPFIKELSIADSNIKTKQIITAFLISLLGKPLIFIDLDPETSAKSDVRESCIVIIKDICTLEKNICKFLEYVEPCFREEQKTKSRQSKCNEIEAGNSPYEHKDKINITTLSGLFYIVFSRDFTVPELATPQVYCIEYIVHSLMFCVIHLLTFTELGPLEKATSLCKALLTYLSCNVSHKLLSNPVQFDLCKSLINVSIYSNYESIRKNAINLIQLHVNNFEYQGRCMLIKYIIDSSNHSGMIGYAITLYKNSFNEAFMKPPLDKCFTGAQLMSMVKKICYLPHGAASDLVELADQIITALNFLRYLALKDTQNITGIRDNFSLIEADYLEKLRTGLNLSKAHYEEKLKELQEGKTLSDKVNVVLNVAGNSLDKIPVENKKEIIYSALNAFHLIEGLIARLSECIIINVS